MRIFDFVGFFCSRRSWHHGIWRPGRSKRGRQYSIGEAVGMHQPKTAGCSQPYAVGSGHPALRSIHAAQTSRTRVFIPSNPARPSPPGWARHCVRALHTLTAPGPHALRPTALLAMWHVAHVAAMLLLQYCIRSFSSPPPACLCSFDKPPTPPPPLLHLEHQRRDASVIPEPSIRTRSAIVFPSSDACCAESCHEAE